MTVKGFQFHSAIGGYHYFQKKLEPEATQQLDCAHKADNPDYYFAMKTWIRGRNDRIVGHSPMEI